MRGPSFWTGARLSSGDEWRVSPLLLHDGWTFRRCRKSPAQDNRLIPAQVNRQVHGDSKRYRSAYEVSSIPHTRLPVREGNVVAHVGPGFEFVEVGAPPTAGDRRARAARQVARHFLARRFQVRHERHQGGGARRLGEERGPRLCSLRLFGSRRIGRPVRRRNRSALARGRVSPCSNAFCHGPQVVVGSSMGGWIALLLARELGTGKRAGRELRGPRADRAGGGFHRSADVEEFSARSEARDSRRKACGCGPRNTTTGLIRSRSG